VDKTEARARVPWKGYRLGDFNDYDLFVLSVANAWLHLVSIRPPNNSSTRSQLSSLAEYSTTAELAKVDFVQMLTLGRTRPSRLLECQGAKADPSRWGKSTVVGDVGDLVDVVDVVDVVRGDVTCNLYIYLTCDNNHHPPQASRNNLPGLSPKTFPSQQSARLSIFPY
jgi:hypothetical protein